MWMLGCFKSCWAVLCGCCLVAGMLGVVDGLGSVYDIYVVAM